MDVVRHLLGMRAAFAAETAARMGYRCHVEGVTGPPWGMKRDGEPRVVRARKRDPSTVAIVVAYEERGPGGSREPPR
ncbi:MAG: hypothetical protein NUV93_08310 [Firmicutes bacterium]|nr:hypothetical protein [Bacillota bacterium]